MDIRPIRSDADHAAALERIDALWGAEPDCAEGAELEVLITLVDAFEAAHHPIAESDPISVLEFMMDQRGLARRDLEPMIGSRARVAEILNRKRPLTLPMIRRLSAGLGIPADLLVRDYPVQRAA
ncbi:MAG: transcriptional regulator [Rhodospirillaceae bacterium]